MASAEEKNHLEVPTAKNVEKKHDPLPEGKYTVLSFDIDTTGKRLIDEIVHISCYSPEKDNSFSEYIMPLMNLNPAARQRHQVRVITVGFFRMLKSMQTFKIMKTKNEFAVLVDFLDHLEKVKAADKDSKGVILLFHEQRKFVPYMIIEAMKKYNLFNRFTQTVQSFVNTHPIAVEKGGNALNYFSLRQTHKVILNPDEGKKPEPVAEAGASSTDAGTTEQPAKSAEKHEEFEGNASVRAKLAYEIAVTLGRSVEIKEQLTSQQLEDMLLKLSIGNAHSINAEVEELKEQEEILERQSTLRPIFINYFRMTLYHRVKAVNFRRILAENGFNIEKLQTTWNEQKKDGLTAAVGKLEELKQEERDELIQLLDHHFDPEKTAVKPHVNRKKPQKENNIRGRGNRRNRRQRNQVKPSNDNNNNKDQPRNTTNVAGKTPVAAAATGGGKDESKKRPQHPRNRRRSFRRNKMNRDGGGELAAAS